MTPVSLNSPHDPRAAPFHRLNDATYRRQVEQNGPFGSGIFVVEGWNSLATALDSRYRVDAVLVAEQRLERLTALLASRRGSPPSVLVAPQEVVDDICGFPLHRGVVASASRGLAQLVEHVIGRARLVLAVEGVNDAENLGSLFRNAAGFGVDGVVMDHGVCDPLSRRCVRVSSGHVLRLDMARAPFPDAVDRLNEAGFRTYALTPDRGARDIGDVTITHDDRVAIAVGAEGPGLSRSTLDRCSDRVRIPLVDSVDSLNVATAAAIGLHRLAPPRP